MSGITLTADQDAAAKAFSQFLLKPGADTFVLEGFSGTGKSTLMKHLNSLIPKIEKTAKLMGGGLHKKLPWQMIYTATTNKAAANLSSIVEEPVKTIQSTIGATVRTDYRSNKTSLHFARRADKDTMHHKIVFIDEASYIGEELMEMIYQRTNNTKLVFVGDPAQLLEVGSTSSPVFDSNLPTARLSQVVRQAEQNQIQELSTLLRGCVEGQPMPVFDPNGSDIVALERNDFDAKIVEEMSREDWTPEDSRVLVWTNQAARNYNQGIRMTLTGQPMLQEGDYAIVNRFIKPSDTRAPLITDQTVRIDWIGESTREHGVAGRFYRIEKTEFFMPDDPNHRQRRVQEARSNEDWHIVEMIDTSWIDLRSPYSSTVNKAQGSTYRNVFIDLTDIGKCMDKNQMYRMLYVAVSRASERVYVTGTV